MEDQMANRKFRYENGKVVEVTPQAQKLTEKPIVSDALGFISDQLGQFEVDRVKHGFTGIEFVPDKDVPQFMQVKASSRSEWARYVKHRGMYDKNSRNGGGAVPSEKEFEELKARMLEKYPINNS
jgi:hypothetical protein